MRHYHYVGPKEIRKRAITGRASIAGDPCEALLTGPGGTRIRSSSDLASWIQQNHSDREADGTITATFVIDLNGELCVAPRRSEHIACAAGKPVLSAGEINFASATEVVWVSNQSTGFCPEPESWPCVSHALRRLEIAHPNDFTWKATFRLCPQCNERNLVKDAWFVCELCGADLPDDYNFPAEVRQARD